MNSCKYAAYEENIMNVQKNSCERGQILANYPGFP